MEGEIIQEQNPQSIIASLEKSFQDWLQENPDLVGGLKKELIKIYGYDEADMNSDGLAIIKIPVTELSIFSTFAGRNDNKAFSGTALDFLRDKDVEFVVAISDKENPKIVSAIMKINIENGEIFSDKVSENGGSLRCERSKIVGWSTFESE
jgi:hypothetical protein